jgi:hypothetical protein
MAQVKEQYLEFLALLTLFSNALNGSFDVCSFERDPYWATGSWSRMTARCQEMKCTKAKAGPFPHLMNNEFANSFVIPLFSLFATCCYVQGKEPDRAGLYLYSTFPCLNASWADHVTVYGGWGQKSSPGSITVKPANNDWACHSESDRYSQVIVKPRMTHYYL